MNVLEICGSLGLGGTEKTMQIFCKYLSKDKFTVFGAGFLEGGERHDLINSYVKELIIAGGSSEIIINFIKENAIEILHWHALPTKKRRSQHREVYKILQFCKTNRIKIIETSPFSTFDKNMDDLVDIKLLVSQTNLIKFIYKYKKQLSNISKYGYLYNPLDLDDLEMNIMSSDLIAQRKNELGIKKEDFVIGKVGRANLWKWDDAIIDIAAILYKHIPDFKIILRSIPEVKRSRIKPYLRDKFILLPESVSNKNVCETYQLSDVILHTSRIGECNSVAINESLFFGKPVITNSTDFRNFTLYDRDNGQIEIIKSGQNGFVENDLSEMAKKIYLLKNDSQLYEYISNNNRIKARVLFDARAITQRLERVFSSGLSKDLQDTMTLDEYGALARKETFLDLAKENIKAIYENIFMS